jgi:hypothetical protein
VFFVSGYSLGIGEDKMPLKSKAQAAYLKNNKPKIFEEFKEATPKGSKLPYKVKKKKK